MKKFITILLISTCILVGTYTKSFSNDGPYNTTFPINPLLEQPLIEPTLEMLQGTVSIFGISREGFGGCSGVLIDGSNGISNILTAKHCITTDEEMYVEDKLVSLIIASKDNDLALLIVEGNLINKNKIALAKENLIIGELGYHIGYPSGNLYVQTGPLTRITKNWEFYEMAAKGGCSGGPVFNKDNELVGILWGGLGDTLALTEPLKDIKEFLNEVKIYTKWLSL